MRSSERSLRVVAAVVVGLAAVVAASFAPDLPISDYLGVPIGLLVASPMRALVRSHRDFKTPALTAVIAAAAALVGQLLAHSLFRNTPNLAVALEAVVTAFAATAERLRALDVGHAQQIAREDMRDLQQWTRELEAKPKPGRIVVSSARVRCATCDELVDAATTTRDEARGIIVCRNCV